MDAPSKTNRLLRDVWLAARVFALLLLGIALGIATSYAVAWNAVLQAGTIPPQRFSLSPDRQLVDHGFRLSAFGFMYAEVWSGSAGERIEIDTTNPDTWWSTAISIPAPQMFTGASLAEIIEAIPNAPKPTVFRDANFTHPFQAGITCAGWPFYSVRYVRIDGRRTAISDAFLPRKLLGGRVNLSTDLPIRPLWPGLAWNTLIFATAWFFLGLTTLFAARRLRRLHRTRHNRCPACAYSLAGVTTNRCPECGHPAANPDLPRVSA